MMKMMNKIIRIYILLLPLTLILGGCGLYSKYKPESVEFDTSAIAATDTLIDPLASMSWRELFTDASLSELIVKGLERNTNLKAAMLNVDQAKATLSASKLAFIPSLGIDASASTGINSNSRFQIGPSASWELDIFGKQLNLKRGAEASYYASEAYCQAARTSLIAAIAESYYTLLMLDSQLQISEETIKTWEKNIQVLNALKRGGRSNEAAVLQATANKIKVEASAETLRKQIAAQENALRSLLLEPALDFKRGTLSAQQFPNLPASGVSLAVLSSRPDVRAAEYELQKSFYDVNVSRAAFYPSITISGNAGWSTQSGTIGDPSVWIANAVGSLSAPLFNRGKNKANLQIAKDQYEIASLKFQQTLLDAGMEVRDALSAWETAINRIELDKKQIETLEQAVKTTQLLMRNSTTTYLEVLTAQQRLLDAQLTETSDQYAEIESIITFFHAIGAWTEK